MPPEGYELDDADPAEALALAMQGEPAEPVAEEGEEIETTELPVVLVNGVHGGDVPRRAHDQDAGLDLYASTDDGRGVILRVGDTALIGTGVAVAIPEGHAGLVCPRSGLAVRHGVTVLNGPGVVDPGYRGEVCVPLVNFGTAPIQIRPGMRIAQLLVVPVTRVEPVLVESLPDSARGEGGFGSTGA